ncbi:MAG: phospholipase D-like domain-containing protein, partial [Methanomicrobiales archaeon]|nr:phospholipase D-like domain-containing protein [Methanomicrobiales archaeon]
MKWTLSLFILSLLILPASTLQFVEFCPDPYLARDADEYLVIAGDGTLDGIAISDGEGGFRFPPGTMIHGRITVARDAAAYATTHGSYPDFELFDHSPAVQDVIRGDDLYMSNTGDELLMYRGTELVDRISWPGVLTAREGQVHFRDGDQWDPRVLLLGQSQICPRTFTDVSLTAFVSPDSSREAFTRALQSANHSVYLNVYEFASPALAQLLADTRARGVTVEVLLEGGPVGGITPEEKCCCRLMNQSGIPIYLMKAGNGEHSRYRFDHAKYFVIDGSAVFLTSENFKESGIPLAGTKGNRGWGVFIRDPRIADYFTGVYRDDRTGIDIEPYVPVESIACATGPGEDYTVEYPSAEISGASVTPVLAPDTSALIAAMIRNATGSVDIEQAYITNTSAGALNPYLAAAVGAARRGVTVR